MVSGTENDPVQMNGEPGDKNCQVKIDPGEAGQAERDAEELEVVHREIMGASAAKSRGFGVRL